MQPAFVAVGQTYVVALVLQPGLRVTHQLCFPVLTIMVLEEIGQKIRLCLKTTTGISQTGARGLCSHRNLHPQCAKRADKPKRPKRTAGARGGGCTGVPVAIPVASWLCLAGEWLRFVTGVVSMLVNTWGWFVCRREGAASSFN